MICCSTVEQTDYPGQKVNFSLWSQLTTLQKLGGGARTQAYIRPVECFHGILSLSSCSWIKERTASHCSSRLCCEDPAKPSPWSSHFLTVSSAPAHWKVLTSASPLLLKSFVFHHHHLKHASSQHLCSLRVSFHHSFMEQKHKKAQKLTAP